MAETFISFDLLKKNAENFGIELDNVALERFDLYARLLAEWNEKINLTAITDPESIVIKHFADSLSVLKYCNIPDGTKLIDVGTGAGFPGLVLMIARPDIKVTLLDSTKKKLNVLTDISEKIGLSPVTLHMRAEEAGQIKDYREQFDFATARAVSNLRELSEYCLPFVKVGGAFLSMKSARADEEIDGAEKAIKVLGGKIIDKNTFNLADAGERTIIEIKKFSSTSPKYPRPSAKIAKNPII